MNTKVLALGVSLLFVALTSRANYTITFDTFDPADFSQHLVFDVNGTTPLSGSAFLGQLYVGATALSLGKIGSNPEPFQTGTPGAGFIAAGPIDVVDPILNAGSSAFYQLRAWQASGGSSYEAAILSGVPTGQSQVMQITLGGTTAGTPPTLLVATANLHPSFALAVPEPSVWAMGLLGGAALLFRRRR